MKDISLHLIQITSCLLFFVHNLYAQAGQTTGSLEIVARYAKNKNDEKIFISLEPRLEVSGNEQRSKSYTVEMKDKEFSQRYLTIKKGDSIEYINRDAFDHNVFSLSPGNRFDLGSFPLGEKGEYEFKTPGIVKIYCNVHSEMASFVLVTDSNWVKTATPNERFKFEQIPLGEYLLYAWSVRGEYKQQLSVTSAIDQQIEIIIDEVKNELTDHVNKFGKPYLNKENEELY